MQARPTQKKNDGVKAKIKAGRTFSCTVGGGRRKGGRMGMQGPSTRGGILAAALEKLKSALGANPGAGGEKKQKN